MSAELLNLTPPIITIKFVIGTTVNPIFYCIGDGNSLINLTGYSARMQARLNLTDVLPITGFDLTTQNGGVSIVTGNATTEDGTVIQNAQGIQINLTPSLTSNLTWCEAYFAVHLIAPDTSVTPLIEGKLIALQDAIQ